MRLVCRKLAPAFAVASSEHVSGSRRAPVTGAHSAQLGLGFETKLHFVVHPWLAGVDPAGSLLVHAMGESRSRRRPRRHLPFPSVSIRWRRSRAHFVSGSPSPMPLEPWIGCSHWIGRSHPPSWRLRAARPPPSFKRHARPVTCAGRCPASRPPSPSGKAIRKSQVAARTR